MTFYAAFYRGTRPGLPGVYNRIVRAWTRGKYSHCELVFSDNQSASASFMDHGVRFKEITFDLDHWDIVRLPEGLEPAARAWFEKHVGQPYDLMGNLHLVVGFIPESRGKQFCSEAIASALGLAEAWRYDPSSLYNTLDWGFRVAR